MGIRLKKKKRLVSFPSKYCIEPILSVITFIISYTNSFQTVSITTCILPNHFYPRVQDLLLQNQILVFHPSPQWLAMCPSHLTTSLDFKKNLCTQTGSPSPLPGETHPPPLLQNLITTWKNLLATIKLRPGKYHKTKMVPRIPGH